MLLLLAFNPIHLAYGVMIIGVVFCYVMSRNQNKDMRKAVDEFALPFVRLSNYISPAPPAKGLTVEELGEGRVRPLPAEQQSGAMRAVMKRANEEESVKLFAQMVEAADEIVRQAGINRTKKSQFAQPVNEILNMTHTFLVGCENPATIDTEEKKAQFDSFLLEQVKHRMVLLHRIRGGTAEEYRELNRQYAREMEEQERQEIEAKRKRGQEKNEPKEG